MAFVAIVAPAADAVREMKRRREKGRLVMVRNPPETRRVYRRRGLGGAASFAVRAARSDAFVRATSGAMLPERTRRSSSASILFFVPALRLALISARIPDS